MNRLATLAKIAFSVAMLAYVLYMSQPARIWPILARADLWLIMLAVLIWIAIQSMNVYKWSMLNRAQGLEIPYQRLLDVYYMGMFFNTFLPSGFGGDALRAYELSRLTERKGSSLISVLVDRATSVYALVLLGSAAIAFAPSDLRLVSTSLLLALAIAGAICFIILLQPTWMRWIAERRLIAQTPRLHQFCLEVAESVEGLRASGWTLFLALAISIAYQFAAVIMHYVLILALGLQVSPGYTMLFMPILTLVASMPVSINGIGIREGGFAYCLGKVGVPAAEAVSVGLLSLGMLLLSGIWGAKIYARKATAPSRASACR